MSESERASVRIDRWVWAVRCYKTRSAATSACRAGHVAINSQVVKAAAPVRVGDRVRVRIGGFDRDLEVTKLLDKRVSAPLAREAYVDHTPPRLPRIAVPAPIVRDKGAGRPTKKERRELDRLMGRNPNSGRRDS
ncbi:RNA-binding S4 domain-containing protein [Nanchangia anserum]|uniref:RNA-binding S4 domain-containing protein n=1 Tax=Nanchangia anserum TaxID=2692125 RepID=A0A8I0GFJ1_9ACTO|nr:S4 domain-containing protein [Nanchangia anserum]MBD3689104.1 RNA-binding S4 domain-containing protein [Nanchangia anserum]QOX81339.1 RNA-binding S4 domain-containing protein [Nanchangia anserum]